MRMRLIVLEREVLVAEARNIVDLRIQLHRRQRIGFARKLLTRLLQMIQIKMRVAETVDELARLQTCDLRHHSREEGIGSDVEGHSQKNVRRPLIELAGELPRSNVELEQAMTGRQRHLVDVGGI